MHPGMFSSIIEWVQMYAKHIACFFQLIYEK